MSRHALLSPSSAHRWAVCHGSVAAELIASQGEIAESSGKYALEGTVAHALAEHCLLTKQHAAQFIGSDWRVFAGNDQDEWIIDADMAGNVNVYIQNMKQYSENADEVLIERWFNLQHITGEEGGGGTSDVTIVKSSLKELQVHDLKYGRGVEVAPDENLQLILYGLGAYEEFELTYDIETILLVIHQPRINSAPQEWRCSVVELMEYKEELIAAAKKVRRIVAIKPVDMLALTSTLYADKKACQWCKAKVVNGEPCPALTASVKEATLLDFDNLDDENILSVSSYNHLSLSQAYKAIPLLEIWIKAVNTAAYSEAFNGRPPEGYKLVEGRRGNKQYSDMGEALKIFDKYKIGDEKYKKTLLTPNQVEEQFKADHPEMVKELKAITKQEDGKPTLVHESNKKPALKLENIRDAFDVIEEEEEGLA